MKCQSLFSGKNKKNVVNLLSAELAQGVVMVKLMKNLLIYRTVIALDKSWYYSQQKCMLWILIKSASSSTNNMFPSRNKRNISIVWLKKRALLSEAM